MKTIDELLEDLKPREGGFVNDPIDKGGPTKFGITQKTLESFRGEKVSINEVKNLTWEEAKTIYRNDYYIVPKIDTLPYDIQPQVFDMGINHGTGTAVLLLQEVCYDIGIEISCDRRIGPKTIAACQKIIDEYGSDFLNYKLACRRLAYYEQIMINNPSQRKYENGWRNRAKEFIPDEYK